MFCQRSFAFVLTASLAATLLHAQVAGRLSGVVVDQTGAAVPGATVNVYVTGGKEPVLKGQSNESGLFSFVTVRPDVYDVGVEAQGFTRTVVREVKVSPIQETALPPIKLELQATTTTVEVASDVQAVQLSNAEISSTVTSEQVQNLPVLGRQVSVLLQTQAGVSAGSNTTTVNGLRPSFSNLTLDGINIQDNFSRTNSLDYAPMRTTIDQIAEITAATSNPNPALGGGTSQFVLSTKSGSNTFHGSVYWYNRNSALAANDWFNNQSGTDKTRIDLNQPGAAVGGRIIRDKLFFYTNYEGFRNKQQQSILRTVLTDSAKNGIFSYRDSAGAVQRVNLSSLRSFVADPTIAGMIQKLPAPNATGTGDGLNTSGYRFNAQANEFRDQFVYKGDYYLSSKHGFSGTYNYINNPTDRYDVGNFYTTKPPVSNTITDHLLSLSWRWTVAPTLTNELRGGFLRTDTAFLGSDYPKLLAGGLVFSNPVNTFLNQGRKVNTYNIQDNATWSRRNHEISFGFQTQLLRVSPFNDAGIIPTYTLGISTANTTGLTAADLPGIRASDLTIANNLYANLAGIVSQAAQTFNVTSTTSGFVPGATNLRNLKQSTYAGYVQDKWRIRPNLTLNLGMRYEYWTPMDETNGLFLAPRIQGGDVRASLLDPNAVLDFIGGPSGRPFYHADKNNFAPNVGFAWDPFSKGKTSIRGGYSISYVNDNLVAAVRGVVGQSSGLSFGNTVPNLVAALASPPAVPPPAYKVPRTLADNFAITSSSNTGIPNPNMSTPYVHQWNIGIEHQIKGLIVSARYVGNRGTGLLQLLDYNQVLYNANGFLGDFLRAQNNGRLASANGGAFNGSYNPSIPGSQQLTVFPLLVNGGNLTNATIQGYLQRGEIGEMANQYMLNRTNGSVSFWPNPNVQGARVLTNTGYSNYHALQFEVTKRTRAGLQTQFSYTFGKALGNTAGDSATDNEALLDNNNPSIEYARSPFDLRHVFKANFYYELPFGKGKHWSGNRVMNSVLGGWAISGIWSYVSGSPYSVLSGYGTLNRVGTTAEHLSDALNTASVNGNVPNLSGLTSGVWKTGDTVYFIDPSIINVAGDGRGAASPGSDPFPGQIFFNPGPGQLGNLQRRMFSGPWEWSFDTSVKKTVNLTERQHVDLHFDLFNFMNHPTFYVYPSTGGDYGNLTPFNVNQPSFGQVDSMNFNPRVIQIGAYYRF